MYSILCGADTRVSLNQDDHIGCCKCVLEAWSPVWMEMIQERKVNDESDCVFQLTLEPNQHCTTKCECLKRILQFIHDGRLVGSVWYWFQSVDYDHVRELATRYQIGRLWEVLDLRP